MYGLKKIRVAGIIIPATLAWTAQNQPVKNPLIGGVITPKCAKNGVEQKTRVNFEVLINDGSEKGFTVVKVACFSSLAAEPGKGFAERIARMIVPGRYIDFEGTESASELGLTNTDGTMVVMNGQQVKKTYVSYIVNPGDIRIYNRDSIDTQILMAQQWARSISRTKSFAWDFFGRPLSVVQNADGTITGMSDAVRATLEGVNKIRQAMPLLHGMITYGFCKVNYPQNAQFLLPASEQYNTWLREYVQLGCLGRDGMPEFTPKVQTPNAGTNASGIPDILGMGGSASKTTEAQVANALGGAIQTGAQGGVSPDALMKAISALMNQNSGTMGAGAAAGTTVAPTVDLSSLGGPSTNGSAAGLPLI